MLRSCRTWRRKKILILLSAQLLIAGVIYLTSFRSSPKKSGIIKYKHIQGLMENETLKNSSLKITNVYHWNGNDTPSAYMKSKLFNFADANVCSKHNSDHELVIVLIASRHEKMRLRNTIRFTWINNSAYEELKFVYYPLFVVNTPESHANWSHLQFEARSTGDLIIANVQPGYHLLTVQLLIGMTWIYERCPSAKYVLKTDDDTYAHLEEMEKNIVKIENEKPPDVSAIYGGTCFEKPKVVRKEDKTVRHYKKWIVDRSFYSPEYFPSYCNGPAYFFSASLLPKIIANCPYHCTGMIQGQYRKNDSNCFWLWEDVFFGSCINTFEQKPYTNFTQPFRYMSFGVPKLKFVVPEAPFAAIHPVKLTKSIINLFKRYHTLSAKNVRTLQSRIDRNTFKINAGMLTP